MRDKITSAMKQAMKDKDTLRVSTLRLVNAAIKDQDIAERGKGNDNGLDDAGILSLLAKMIKQRQESAATYADAGREELAKQETDEIKVIEEFLPKQLSDDEIKAAVEKAIKDQDASSIRDMGKVMGVLKAEFAGQMDFGKAGGIVKSMLG
ncbi:MAG: GatB/YqeY domain-containing protein [Pseudomonadota bacterium]